MMKWDDIAERADAIVGRAMKQWVGEERCRNAVVRGNDGGQGDGVEGEEEEREKALAERLRDADYVCAAMEARKRYDYRRAFGQLRRMSSRPRRSRWMWRAVGVAASVLLAVGIYFFGREGRKMEAQPMVVQLEPVRQVKAVLIKADGGELRLDVRGFSGKESGSTIVADSAGLQYEADERGEQGDTLVYHTLIVPRGGVYHLTLADGSEVWLNSDSRLRYPVNFSGATREVFLTGEAYLSVKRNEQQPFIVTTDLGSVRVLGTEFNVKCYPDEKNVEATLVTGSISFSNKVVENALLAPGYQLAFDPLTEKVSVREVNVAYFVSWREDKMSFHNERLEDIMRVFSRWFNVEVVFRDEYLKDLLYTGNLDKYDNIETFLHLFELGGMATFDVLDNVVFVRQKKITEMEQNKK